jgi:hypothetical protein
MTDDLIAFLRARFDEDDEEARRGYLKAEPTLDYDGWDRRTTAGLPPVVATRVLREVEMKRRIMDEALFIWNSDVDGVFGSGWDILRMLAVVYADHPDYRQEWAP